MKKLFSIIIFYSLSPWSTTFASVLLYSPYPRTHLNEHAVDQLRDGVEKLKKQFSYKCSGPLYQKFMNQADHIKSCKIEPLHIEKLAQTFKQDAHIEALASKIKNGLQTNAQMRADIHRCIVLGDKKSCKRFEGHLHTITRQHCGIECLFSKQKKDAAMAAAFVAATHCLVYPEVSANFVQ